jgi:ketosteroid isomerase-like protein
LLRYWADDATNFFPGAPVAQGKQAIRALVELNRSQPGFALTWEPVHAAVAASGDLGYTWGTFQLTKLAADGEPATRSGHYVAIWRRHDGHWKCEVESTVFLD